MAEIAIKAKGATSLPIDQLVIIQGNLKELSEKNYAKLHDLIITKGFDSPIQIWEAPDGTKQILDGSQRLRVLLKLREEGYSIPEVPIDLIYADNEKDARERLLTKVSQYGEVTEEGLYEFTNYEGAIIEPDFSELLDIPNFDFDKDTIEVKGRGETITKELECPSCGHKWTP